MKFQKGLRFACGCYHTLVVTEKRELFAWGGNEYGQVGDGTVLDKHRPVTILGENEVEAVAAGRHHSLAVTVSGAVLAWGSNDDCLLGTGWRLKQEVPVTVIESGVTAVAAGWRHSLALTEAGEVLAWGGNEYGQLGDGSKSARHKPVKVIPGGVKVIAAGWYHSLAVLDTGEVLTWGLCSVLARAGSKYALTPIKVEGLPHTIRQIAAGGTHSLALADEGGIGVLWAWGGNEYGQLGDGSMSRRLTPVPVANDIQRVAAGYYHSVAITDDSDILAWGFKPSGNPGGDYLQGASWTTDIRPTKVHLPGGAFAVAAGGVHSLAESHKGEVFAWGGNSTGQLGKGDVYDREFPALALGPSTMEVIPFSEQIAAILNNKPKELEKSESDDSPEAKRKAFLGRLKPLENTSNTSLQRSTSSAAVPELLLRITGSTGSFHVPSPAARYPLTFDGGKRRSLQRSKSLTTMAKTVSEWPSSCRHKDALPLRDETGLRSLPHVGSRKPSLVSPLALTYG